MMFFESFSALLDSMKTISQYRVYTNVFKRSIFSLVDLVFLNFNWFQNVAVVVDIVVDIVVVVASAVVVGVRFAVLLLL